jgi:hypothetical protein
MVLFSWHLCERWVNDEWVTNLKQLLCEVLITRPWQVGEAKTKQESGPRRLEKTWVSRNPNQSLCGMLRTQQERTSELEQERRIGSGSKGSTHHVGVKEVYCHAASL